MGYKFQFVTLAGFHQPQLRHVRVGAEFPRRAVCPLIRSCRTPNLPPKTHGYTATRHQREVGTGYFDLVNVTISSGGTSTTAMSESTEHAQFTAALASAAE